MFPLVARSPFIPRTPPHSAWLQDGGRPSELALGLAARVDASWVWAWGSLVAEAPHPGRVAGDIWWSGRGRECCGLDPTPSPESSCVRGAGGRAGRRPAALPPGSTRSGLVTGMDEWGAAGSRGGLEEVVAGRVPGACAVPGSLARALAAAWLPGAVPAVMPCPALVPCPAQAQSRGAAGLRRSL